MEPTLPVIETRDLRKSYTLGKEVIEVLHGISITVPRGDYVAIMGPSGSGKSTLLNILGCLDLPSVGDYILNGKSLGSMTQSRLADIRNSEIGFVFQNFNLLPKLDISANVELPLIYGNVPARERKQRVEEILNRMGLWDRRAHRPNEISGGQKQRAAIARALVKRPTLILADEPTGNLDSHTSNEILDLLAALHASGNTIMLITHEHDVASRASRLMHLIDGRIGA